MREIEVGPKYISAAVEGITILFCLVSREQSPLRKFNLRQTKNHLEDANLYYDEHLVT